MELGVLNNTFHSPESGSIVSTADKQASFVNTSYIDIDTRQVWAEHLKGKQWIEEKILVDLKWKKFACDVKMIE